MLRVTVMGTVSAWRDGEELDLGGPRQRAVLGLLVAAGRRTVSTDRFVEDLWEGEPPAKALGALQVYVSNLRKVLEPGRQRRQPARVLTSVAPGYQLVLPEDAVDTWWFAALVREARSLDDPVQRLERLDRALALWTDEPFAAHADLEWARLETTRLTDLHSEAVRLWATTALDLGRTAEAVGALEAHVQAHPLREHGVRLLALALYRAERQSDALAALAAVRRRLVDELGVDPSPELRELEADILDHAPHLRAPVEHPAAMATTPGPPAAAPAPVVPVDPVFGREDELARLHAALAGGDGPAVVWVAGEAGIGKSTLVDRLCDESVGTWTVARGQCPEVDGAPPGWAWFDALGDLLGRPTDVVAARASTAFDLAHGVVEAIAAASHDVLLVLDDLHRADGETLQVLRHVLSSPSRRLVVVGTFRGDEVGPDLAMAIAATSDHLAERLELQGLPMRTARAVLETVSGVRLPEGVLQQLLRRSGGNPLYLKQVARLAASQGPDIAVSQVPSAIHEILGLRLGRLPAATVDLLSRAALLGRDVDLDLLVAVEESRGTATEDEVVDALDAGIVAGLVSSATPERLVFEHALVRDALYDRLPPMRRRRLHGVALDILERDHPERVVAMAHHAAAALDLRRAPRAAVLLSAAADELLAAGSHAEAADLVRLSLEAHELAGSPVVDTLAARRSLQHAIATSGDLRAAHAARATSVDLAFRHGDESQRRRSLVWASPTAWSIRELHATDHVMIERLRGALAAMAQEPDDEVDEALRVQLLSTLTLETEGSALADLAFESAAEAVVRARALGDPAVLCVALNAAYLTTYPPRPHGSLRTVGLELLEASRAARLPAFEAIGHYAMFGAAAADGDLTEAQDHAAEAIRRGTAGQLPLLLVVSGLFEGLLQLVRGRLDEAAATYRDVTEHLVASGDPNGRIMQLILAFTVDHARGDTSAHVEAFREIDAIIPHENHDYLVATLLDAGATDEARARWSPQVELKHDYFWLYNATLRLENAVRLEDVEHVRAMLALLTPWSGQVGGLVAGTCSLGPVDIYLARAHRLLGDEEEAHRLLDVAEETARRYEAPQWLAEAARVR
ncbi:MAG: BTAD domain-containing putative transcriptional regulator [Aeromicrobium erythreum]